MSRTYRSEDPTYKNSNEGTSARTRPVSAEEFMLRREKKSSAEAERRSSEVRDPFEEADANGGLRSKDYKDKAGGNSKRSELGVEENSKMLEEKDNSKRLEEAFSKREQEYAKGRTKLNSSNNKSSRDEEKMREKESHSRSRASKWSGADSEKISEKKHIQVSMEKNKYEEKDRKSGHEGKRKYESRVDDKPGSVIDESNLKKNDSDSKDRKVDGKRRSVVDDSNLKKHDLDSKDRKVDDKRRSVVDDSKLKKHDLDSKDRRVDNKRRSVIDDSNLKKHDSEWKDRKVDNKRQSVIDDSIVKMHDSDCKDQKVDDKRRPVIDDSDLKKHDSDRRDQKKEHTQIYREELKVKRRRSRDRSASVSPREHKHPFHGKDYAEPSFESFKDKSRRKYSDHDSYKTQGNSMYSGGHYRKHGSGLGGYSPRKRRTEAAVKTPSPPKRALERNRSPEKKSSTWDQPPISGSIHANFHSNSSKIFEANTVAAVKSQPVPSFDTASMVINASIDSVHLTQATRPKRTLYIENLPLSASEKTVTACLNGFLLSSGANRIQGANPCISCIINKEKHQAVVEFLTPEDATSAISFDGRSLLGSVLKIRRPKEFVEAAIRAPEKTVPEKKVPTIKVLSEAVKDSPNKIFIGGISKALSSDMLLDIVRVFGVLKAYHFEFNEELNGQCAFLEYEDHSLTQKACAGLNGMKLGGQLITAVQVFPDSHGEECYDKNLESYNVPSQAKYLLADSTRVLQLKNVFNLEEFPLLSESEVEETLEDIRLECTRFGTVKSINVVRFNSKHTSRSEGAEQKDAHPHNDSAMISSLSSLVSTSSENGKKEDVNMTTWVDERQLQDVKDASGQGHDDSSNENPLKDNESNESANPDSSQLEDSSKLDNSVPTVPPEIPVNIEVTAEKLADSEVHPGNGDNEQILLENIDPNIFVAEKGNVGSGDGNHQLAELDVFEPECVLVEFLREEAACNAAHCLHQRYYGERIVLASYVSYDLYIAQFPK